MTTRKLSEITTQVTALAATDRFEVSQDIATTPVTKYATPDDVLAYVRTGVAPIAVFKGTTGNTSVSDNTTVTVPLTEAYDPAGFASVASNEVTLGAGTYLVHAQLVFEKASGSPTSVNTAMYFGNDAYAARFNVYDAFSNDILSILQVITLANTTAIPLEFYQDNDASVSFNVYNPSTTLVITKLS